MKLIRIFGEALPVAIMILLIPVVINDYVLAFIYLVLAIILLLVRRQRNDVTVFIFGLIALTISEYFFISTGVEIFKRVSLFGTMPIWLPILWGYAFVAIKRSVRILDSNQTIQ